MLILDPTVPKNTETITWIALMGLLFIFFLNLIRHSVIAVIYAGILTYICFFSMILIVEGRLVGDMFAMSVSLGFMIFIGTTVTRSNRKMMERYLAPQLVKELYKNQASLEAGYTG